MTTGKPPRRAQRGFPGQGGRDTGSSSSRGRNGTLPEQLRSAREAKGVDLYRVERDTKIRSKFLAALENGDYSDLPGEVYTRGFLRNYASYLGLDPDEAVDEWRRERGESDAHQPLIGGPKPMATPPRGLVLQRSHMVMVLLAVVVIGVVGYFGLQITRYLQDPTVIVTTPATEAIQASAGTTTYKLAGSATPGTTILIMKDLRESMSATVDASGHWSLVVSVHPGRNEFDITASNTDTNHKSSTVKKYIDVSMATATPTSPQIYLAAPTDGASIVDGAVTVSGSSFSLATVTVTSTLLGPPPKAGSTPTPVPSPTAIITPKPTPKVTLAPGATASPSQPPAGTTTTVAADGSFTLGLQLAPGSWQLTVTGASSSGAPASPVTVTIVVPYKPVQVIVDIEGGATTLKIWRDGVLDPKTSNRTYKSGARITIDATQSVWVWTGIQRNTYFTINGVLYGQLSTSSGTGSWRMDGTSPPKKSNDH